MADEQVVTENTVTKEEIEAKILTLKNAKGTLVWDSLIEVLGMIVEYATPAEETVEETVEENPGQS